MSRQYSTENDDALTEKLKFQYRSENVPFVRSASLTVQRFSSERLFNIPLELLFRCSLELCDDVVEFVEPQGMLIIRCGAIKGSPRMRLSHFFFHHTDVVRVPQQ